MFLHQQKRKYMKKANFRPQLTPRHLTGRGKPSLTNGGRENVDVFRHLSTLLFLLDLIGNVKIILGPGEVMEGV